MEEKQKLVKITDTLSIHLPENISAAAEAEFVALLRKDAEEPERVEAEWRQILKDHEEGRTIPAERMLRELEEFLQGLSHSEGRA